MPFVLIITGVVLLVAAVRNTQQYLFLLLAKDFTGTDNFIYWLVSLLIIGAVGYIPRAKPISVGFMTLVILVLFLKKGTGFFDKFNQQIGLTQTAQPQVSPPQTGGGATTGGTVTTGGGSSVNLGTPCRPGIDPGCGSNGRYGGPGVTPPPVIYSPGAGPTGGGGGGVGCDPFNDPFGFLGGSCGPLGGSGGSFSNDF